MTPDGYTLIVEAPCSFVNENSRLHWAVKHKLMRAWKERTAWCGMRAAFAAHASWRAVG